MVFQAFMRVGALQAGLMSDWLGAPMALGLGAVLSLAYGLWVAAVQTRRETFYRKCKKYVIFKQFIV